MYKQQTIAMDRDHVGGSCVQGIFSITRLQLDVNTVMPIGYQGKFERKRNKHIKLNKADLWHTEGKLKIKSMVRYTFKLYPHILQDGDIQVTESGGSVRNLGLRLHTTYTHLFIALIYALYALFFAVVASYVPDLASIYNGWDDYYCSQFILCWLSLFSG